MYHCSDSSLVGADDLSAPSEAGLLAQAILGNPLPDPRAAAGRMRHKRELLKFVADISDRARDERSRLRPDGAQLGRDHEFLEWLASIIEEYELELRDLQRQDAEARQRYAHLIESLEL
jgi:hypothetical protein